MGGVLLPKGTSAGRDFPKARVPVTLLPLFTEWGEVRWRRSGGETCVTLKSGIPSHVGERQKIANEAPWRRRESRRKCSNTAVWLSRRPAAARLPLRKNDKWEHTSGVDDFLTIAGFLWGN